MPALAVYLIGAPNITFLKELKHRRMMPELKVENKDPGYLPTGWTCFFVTLHITWLLVFIGYLFFKKAL